MYAQSSEINISAFKTFVRGYQVIDDRLYENQNLKNTTGKIPLSFYVNLMTKVS